MTSAVSFGKLTFATKSVQPDILAIYKKNVQKLKNSKTNEFSFSQKAAANVDNKEIEESLEKAKKESHKFGELTGINEDYYRPMEKVTSRIDDAQEDSKKPSFLSKNSEMEEIRKSVEEARDAQCA